MELNAVIARVAVTLTLCVERSFYIVNHVYVPYCIYCYRGELYDKVMDDMFVKSALFPRCLTTVESVETGDCGIVDLSAFAGVSLVIFSNVS